VLTPQSPAQGLRFHSRNPPRPAPLEPTFPLSKLPLEPIIIRAFTTAALTITLVSAAQAQDGPLNRVGRALDQTGKSIRATVEDGVARGQITAQERDVLNRVGKRLDWDKKMAGSTLRIEVQPGSVVILQGSVPSEAVKLRAVDLVENTVGVTSVVDQLAVVKGVRVIEAPPAVIETGAAPVIEVERPVVVTPPAKVIVKP
jgi:hyperosmotically inducible periplasmic protein